MTTSADEPLDHAERWLIDSLRVLRPSVATYQITVDMANGLQRLDALRKAGTTASATHLLVHAAAKAFAANPALHQVISSRTRHRPSSIDIGLSITGDTFVAPVLVFREADKKTVAQLAEETARRVPEVQREDRERLAGLRKWGWLMPFAFVRRMVMRRLFADARFQRERVGTFQVTTVPVDWAATSVFVSTGVLVGGQVRSRVVAVDGQPAVRPTMTVTLCGDHAVWDGRGAARYLAAVKSQLESSGS